MKILIHHKTFFYFRNGQITEIVPFVSFYIAIFLFSVIGFFLHAQAPQALNYQAVCRDTNGTPLAQQLVTYRASVLQGSPSATVVYSETHTDTTNMYGISTLQIGRGTPVQGTFASIHWGSGSFYMSLELDPAGGNNYRNLGAPELLSVPYALQSNDGIAKGTITNQLLFWNGTAWDTLNPSSSSQMLTICNGNLIWGNCPGTISGLSCSTAVHSGQLVEGLTAISMSMRLAYTGGNGCLYAAQTIASTGVTGLTASVLSGHFVNGNDSVTITISGTPVGNGLANFSLVLGGQSCVLTRNVIPAAALTLLDCSNAIHTGTLDSGVAASVYSRLPYAGGNGGGYSAQSYTSNGVTGLTASIGSGTLVNGNDSLTISISGTPSTSGIASFFINIGGQSCTLTLTVNSALITGLACSTAVNVGSLVQGVAASGVNSTISYTGGNGGPHNGQIVSSTGVTGLTATLSAGTFAIGNGTLVYIISGTPSASGTASFNISIGGLSCMLTRTVTAWRTGMVHCGSPTAIVPITNPITNKTWMDRNLGASQVATSSADANAYGDLYQWGRFGDGHQCRNSGTTSTLSFTDSPGNGLFIIWSDWRSPQNDNLWQGVNGINNPCPIFYRLPTMSEMDAERLSWTSNNAGGAFASPLKLTLGGYRNYSNGTFTNVGFTGHYQSVTVAGSSGLDIQNGYASTGNSGSRGGGFSVRCIQD